MKLDSQSVQYQIMKLKKNEFIKKQRKFKLVIPFNGPMNFLKFNKMFFFRNFFLII